MQVVYLVASLMGVALCKKLPSFLEICSRSDPKILECLHRNIDTLRPMFLEGVPELQIPSLNPLLIDTVTFGDDVGIKVEFTNLRIYQLNNFTIEKLDLDLDNFKLDLTLTFPRLRILADCHITGKFLGLELDGRGPADGNYTDVRGHFKGEGSRINTNGKDYVNIDKTLVDMEIGKAHLYFDRIFGDQEDLNANTNKLINDNIKAFIKELKPVVAKIVEEFIGGITKRLFKKYPFDDLFKP
nr:uncharacterized protein LOC111510433 isoform X2 [Leptinotarsa decemlineata]